MHFFCRVILPPPLPSLLTIHYIVCTYTHHISLSLGKKVCPAAAVAPDIAVLVRTLQGQPFPIINAQDSLSTASSPFSFFYTCRRHYISPGLHFSPNFLEVTKAPFPRRPWLQEATRLTFQQFQSLKIRLSTVPNYIKFTGPRILEL